MKNSSRIYDVIIVNLPPPYTIQFNRFYSNEFYQIAANHLKEGGIFTFATSGAENYFSDDLSRYLRTLDITLKSCFKHVSMIPGESVHFIASNNKHALTLHADTLITRMQNRAIYTKHLHHYQIRLRLSDARRHMLRTALERDLSAVLNTDFRPAAFLYSTVFWSSQFSTFVDAAYRLVIDIPFAQILFLVFLLILIATVFIFSRNYPVKNEQHIYSYSVFVSGFSAMAFEIMLLLAFQILQGSLYYQLAVIIALFMTGMATGTYSAQRLAGKFKPESIKKILLIMHSALIIMPFVLIFHFDMLQDINGTGFWLVFAAITIICGGFAGMGFPLTGNLFYRKSSERQQNPGTVYSADLIGAMFGTLSPALIFIPVYGFLRSAVILSIINLSAALFILGLLFLKPGARQKQMQ